MPHFVNRPFAESRLCNEFGETVLKVVGVEWCSRVGSEHKVIASPFTTETYSRFVLKFVSLFGLCFFESFEKFENRWGERDCA